MNEIQQKIYKLELRSATQAPFYICRLTGRSKNCHFKAIKQIIRLNPMSHPKKVERDFQFDLILVILDSSSRFRQTCMGYINMNNIATSSSTPNDGRVIVSSLLSRAQCLGRRLSRLTTNQKILTLINSGPCSSKHNYYQDASHTISTKDRMHDMPISTNNGHHIITPVVFNIYLK